MFQIECPLCLELCEMEMTALVADGWVLRCDTCNLAVDVGGQRKVVSEGLARAA